MKKKLTVTLLSDMMVVTSQAAVFADTEVEVAEEKSNTEADQMVSEKIDDAVRVLQEEQPQLPVGAEYGVYEYDLGDNCTLRVELQDRAEDKEQPMTVRPMATSGSANVWKEYGNRYFTAKATVACGSDVITLSLENHYMLSVNGIDERYGTPDMGGVEMSRVEMDSPVISKSTARSVNSVASIYCNFACKAGIRAAQKYKLNTTVKYLKHDKAGKRLQVQQAWNLTKVS